MSSFTKQFCTFAALFTVVSGICFASSANAQSVFSFSVTNTIGNVSGTFTGEIYGLLDNATSSASSVVIESIPDGMFNLEAVPIDAITWDQQYQNSFTVSGGQIVGGAFWAQKNIGGNTFGYQLYLNGAQRYGFNFLNLDGNDSSYVQGENGIAGANFATAISAVPEPGAVALFSTTAVAGLGLAMKRRRSKRA